MNLEFLQYLSIIIEAFIAIFSLVIGIKKKKNFWFGFFITFAIYVFYDFTKLANFEVSANLLYFGFFIATLSALWVVLNIPKK